MGNKLQVDSPTFPDSSCPSSLFIDPEKRRSTNSATALYPSSPTKTKPGSPVSLKDSESTFISSASMLAMNPSSPLVMRRLSKKSTDSLPPQSSPPIFNDSIFDSKYHELTDEGSVNTSANELSERKMNVILLGCGGSAKTTIFKQLKLLGKRRGELLQSFWQEGIIAPCFDTLISIFNRKNLYYPNAEYKSAESEETEQSVFDMFDTKGILNVTHSSNGKLIQQIVDMWDHEPILKKVYTEMLLDNQVESVAVEDINYYFSRAIKVHKGDKATDKDLLISQRKTTGVTHVEFRFGGGNTVANVWDCGGQKNERKKWPKMLREAEKLGGKIFFVFCVALSEYNQLCYEDDTTNRTTESLSIFETIVNSPQYNTHPIFLVFTKKDIFKQKLRYTNLSVCFSDCPDDLKHDEDTSNIKRDLIQNWTGFLEDRRTVSDEIYQKSLNFMKEKFLSKVQDPTRRKTIEKYIKVINAMDADDIKQELVENLFEQAMLELTYQDDMIHFI
ncbi:hypothetical protein FDP41_009222 [Naegleria fowleri]|uniref:Uncharacterized protein n=1 Tax=Naegleria fowleri TaxID=5763 RepID=A0A6A5BH22_NAEFO|nr:uncharacterized protein FDP41_009222 [Naegleria fowleri]KAF0972319.1 hypothetical protein FDP41_009222 [Naegleria fowleri]